MNQRLEFIYDELEKVDARQMLQNQCQLKFEKHDLLKSKEDHDRIAVFGNGPREIFDDIFLGKDRHEKEVTANSIPTYL